MSEWGCLTSMESSKTLKPNSDSLPKVPKLLPPIETKVVNEVDPETREKRYDLCCLPILFRHTQNVQKMWLSHGRKDVETRSILPNR